MDAAPEQKKWPTQRGSSVWLLLSLVLGWAVGAAGFALVIQPILGPVSYEFFAMPPIVAAIASGFFVGLIAAQIATAGNRQSPILWTTLAGTFLGMVLGTFLGYQLAYAIRSAWMDAMYAVYFGIGGALAGGWIAKSSKRLLIFALLALAMVLAMLSWRILQEKRRGPGSKGARIEVLSKINHSPRASGFLPGGRGARDTAR